MRERRNSCMNGGRPKIKKATKERAYKMYQNGRLTTEEICRRCEFSRTTLYRILKEYETSED